MATRKGYEALLAALERFPEQREAVLRWATETGTAPDDPIWEYVSAAFLASAASAAATDSTLDALHAVMADIPERIEAGVTSAIGALGPQVGKDLAAAAVPVLQSEINHAFSIVQRWKLGPGATVAPAALAIVVMGAVLFGDWEIASHQAYSAGYEAGARQAAATHRR